MPLRQLVSKKLQVGVPLSGRQRGKRPRLIRSKHRGTNRQDAENDNGKEDERSHCRRLGTIRRADPQPVIRHNAKKLRSESEN
jgi:hypothetical protein